MPEGAGCFVVWGRRMEDLACAQEPPGALGGVGAHEMQVPMWRARGRADGVRAVSSVGGRRV